VLAADADFLDAAAREAWDRAIAFQSDAGLAFRREVFLALPLALQRRLLRRAAAALAPDLRDVDFAAIQRALDRAAGRTGGVVDLAGGLRLEVEGGRVWLYRGDEVPRGFGAPLEREYPWLEVDLGPLALPCAVALPGGRQFRAAWADPDPSPPEAFFRTASPWSAWIEGGSIQGALALRRPRPGDRFDPLGLEGHTVKLSDFWINEKVPRRARQGWPLLVDAVGILWVPGFRPAHRARVTPRSGRLLRVELAPLGGGELKQG
jgi:tRNA(Ile)-lysidine synthase